jgi:hypothetical protein
VARVVTLSGTASDSGKQNHGIQQITVNGNRASSDTASGGGTANWSKGVTLNPGANNITVMAYDNSINHNTTTQTITIYYQPVQPLGFFDDFSTDKAWVGYEPGGWDRNLAKAGGGVEAGKPDPGADYTVSTDNHILGFAIGADYPNDLSEKPIVSPPVDCTGQDQVFLKFRRWLNVESNEFDHARIYVSNDGVSWGGPFWENPPIDLTDNQWIPFVLDISSVAANQATVYIKFTMGPTNSSRRFSGWNIDDFEVTSEAIYPSEGTMGTEMEIAGSNFGTKKGKVLIGTTALTIIDWGSDLIHCHLTKPLARGVYDILLWPQ